MIKVVIADDQQIIREGIKYLIEQDNDIRVDGFAGNGKEALKLCEQNIPHVVLMDIVMPIVDGIEGVRLIKERFNSIKVIMLTTFNDDERVSTALNYGADGYMLKDSTPEELIMTIKGVALGLNIVHKSTFTSICKHINQNTKASLIKKDCVPVNLSDKEISIVKLIVNGKDNSEIAAALFLSEGSTRNIISAILKKLNLRDRIQLAVYAVKNDIV